MAGMPILESAAPLSLPARPELTDGRRVGVLLCHGFTGSPAAMRPWGEYLGSLGYGVEVPRLPGHGTTWREMNRTGWRDWHAEVERCFKQLVRDHDDVMLAGLSMGGSLVLRLAADHPDQVSGIVLVNPGVAMDLKILALLPVLKWVIPGLRGVAGDVKKQGVDELGYSVTPLKALDSMLRGWKILRGDLGRVRAPILYFHSAEDHVVDPSSSRIIAAGVSSTDFEERTLRDSYHVATIDNDAERIQTESAEFISRVTNTRSLGPA